MHDFTRIEDLHQLANRLVEVVQDVGDRLSKVGFQLLIVLLLLPLILLHEGERLATQLLEKGVAGDDTRHDRILHLVVVKELANGINKLQVGHLAGD